MAGRIGGHEACLGSAWAGPAAQILAAMAALLLLASPSTGAAAERAATPTAAARRVQVLLDDSSAWQFRSFWVFHDCRLTGSVASVTDGSL